jgi:hypothetical protein
MKCPEKCRINNWFLLHDNAPAYRWVLATNFLAKEDVRILEHPPYCTDLAAADVCLFPTNIGIEGTALL